jgi:phosphoribosylformylglycinamidine synthase subunit PurS
MGVGHCASSPRSLPGPERFGFGAKTDVLEADLTAFPAAGDDPRIEGSRRARRSFAYQTRRRGRRRQRASPRRSVGRRYFEVVPSLKCACSHDAGKYGEGVKAKVIVMPKAAVLDPQGNAVRDAMRHLGMPEVRSVRIGKYMEIDIDGRNGDLETRLRSLCRDLLSNPVIEDYQLKKAEDKEQRKTPNAQLRKPKTRKGK